MKDLKFEDLPKAMELILEKISSIESDLNNLKQNFQPKEPEELMTRKETAEYLKIDSTTLWHWTNKGKVTAYGIGARSYYKRSEIINSLVKLKK
ncbi:helix-turn-helix domain-containing protein [Mariniflexile soesokkakense]|uniref:Helix-turn-helix domain-containing protein n=1 Tax=Mariniflexile soesokkakense TaxID=1343160 RepID=A0ABV0ACK7_9FLAO